MKLKLIRNKRQHAKYLRKLEKLLNIEHEYIPDKDWLKDFKAWVKGHNLKQSINSYIARIVTYEKKHFYFTKPTRDAIEQFLSEQ